ncbi:MAG: formate/nitrite transporter family protein [Methanospirillum sp.]
MAFHPPVAIVAKAGDAGKYKTGLPAWNMLLRGFFSGAFIAMGAGLATVCSTGILAGTAATNAGFVNAGFASAGIAQLVLGAVFPVGLIITILTGAELFTGDAMLAPVAAFIHKVSWASVLNLWVWVYIGNLIGSLVWAYIMSYGPYTSVSATGTITASAFGVRAVQIGIAKISYFGTAGLWSAFLKGIGCNWLVNLAVLLGICADDLIGKFFGIWFPIMAFVSSGLEHSIANMMFIPAALMTQPYLTEAQIATLPGIANLNWVTMWTQNIIPVTLGNIVGGMIFVGLLYWIAFRKEIQALK